MFNVSIRLNRVMAAFDPKQALEQDAQLSRAYRMSCPMPKTTAGKPMHTLSGTAACGPFDRDVK
jgi:hypothetical protein